MTNDDKTTTTTDTDLLRDAYRLGVQAAVNAQKWALDRALYEPGEYTTPTEDLFLEAPYPNLSGEWADDPTPTSLAYEVLGANEWDLDPELVADIADEWERGVDDAWGKAAERSYHKAIEHWHAQQAETITIEGEQ